MANNSVSREQFANQLHPVLRDRLNDLLEDMRDRGWKPFVPNVSGKYATGYRTLNAQALAAKDGRSGVKFGFHNITDPAGKPQSLAVHVTDPSQYGTDAVLKKQFQQDLLSTAERYGMTTGLNWMAKNKKGKLVSKPDELHVQIGAQEWLKDPTTVNKLKRGIIPSFPPPLITQPAYVRAMNNGSMQLKSRFAPPLTTPKPIWSPPKPMTIPVTRHQFESGARMNLALPRLGSSLPQPPPWNNVNRQPFRPMSQGFVRPTGFTGMNLKSPTISPTMSLGSMKLTNPTFGQSLGIQRPSYNLGNFQLRPPSI